MPEIKFLEKIVMTDSEPQGVAMMNVPTPNKYFCLNAYIRLYHLPEEN